jgi:hypothetical protein
MGRASKRSGELLRLAEREFNVFLTVDRNLQHQQDPDSLEIAVIVLVARSNRLDDFRPPMDTVRESLSIAKRGEALLIEDRKG